MGLLSSSLFLVSKSVTAFAAEEEEDLPPGPVRTFDSQPSSYDLETAAKALGQRLEALRGKHTGSNMWPRVFVSLERPFMHFSIRRQPTLDIIRLVLTAFQTDDHPVEIRQEHVGLYWSCLQMYAPASGVVIVLATSRNGENAISIEKERSPDKSEEDWASWSDHELDFVTALYAKETQVMQASVSELEQLGLRIFTPDRDAITWDDIAGYEDVKSEVQNTIVLALKHPEVYDGITAQTRKQKQASSLPKAILFEGSPGVGKVRISSSKTAHLFP